MRLPALIPLVAAVLLVSGCTQPAQDGNVQDIPPVFNESVAAGNGSVIATSPGTNWYCGSFKLNSSLAEGRTGMVEDAARQAGFSFIGMVINFSLGDPYARLDACRDMTAGGFPCIPGQVIGNCEGWLLAVGVDEPLDMNGSLDDMISTIHEKGGVALITHPMQKGNCTEWRRWDIPGFDGLAVVSPMTQRRQDDEEAVEKWQILLNNGMRMYAVGETDTKPFTTTYGLRNMLDSSYQCLYIEGNLTEDSVKEALRSGRFYVTNGPVVNFTVNGHGPGEEFNASYGDEVTVYLDVSSASAFSRVRIIKNGIVIQEIGKSLNRYSTNITSLVAHDAWFSADVWGSDYTPEYHDFLHAIANPVWVRVEGTA